MVETVYSGQKMKHLDNVQHLYLSFILNLVFVVTVTVGKGQLLTFHPFDVALCQDKYMKYGFCKRFVYKEKTLTCDISCQISRPQKNGFTIFHVDCQVPEGNCSLEAVYPVVRCLKTRSGRYIWMQENVAGNNTVETTRSVDDELLNNNLLNNNRNPFLSFGMDDRKKPVDDELQNKNRNPFLLFEDDHLAVVESTSSDNVTATVKGSVTEAITDSFTAKSKDTVTVQGKDSVTPNAEDSVTVQGKHSVTVQGKDHVTVQGKDSVTAKSADSVTAQAKDSVTVKGKDSVTVQGTDSVTPNAEDSVTVQGKHSVTVQGKDRVTVQGTDSVTAKSSGSVTAQPKDNVTVKGKDNVTVKGEKHITVKPNDSVTANSKYGVTVHGKDSFTVKGKDHVTVKGPKTITAKPIDTVTVKGKDNVKAERKDSATAKRKGSATAKRKDSATAKRRVSATAKRRDSATAKRKDSIKARKPHTKTKLGSDTNCERGEFLCGTESFPHCGHSWKWFGSGKRCTMKTWEITDEAIEQYKNGDDEEFRVSITTTFRFSGRQSIDLDFTENPCLHFGVDMTMRSGALALRTFYDYGRPHTDILAQRNIVVIPNKEFVIDIIKQNGYFQVFLAGNLFLETRDTFPRSGPLRLRVDTLHQNLIPLEIKMRKRAGVPIFTNELKQHSGYY